MDGSGPRTPLRATLGILLTLLVLGLGWVSTTHEAGPTHDDTCAICQVAHGGWTVVDPPAPLLPRPSVLDAGPLETRRTPRPGALRLPSSRGPPSDVDVPDSRA